MIKSTRLGKTQNNTFLIGLGLDKNGGLTNVKSTQRLGWPPQSLPTHRNKKHIYTHTTIIYFFQQNEELHSAASSHHVLISLLNTALPHTKTPA